MNDKQLAATKRVMKIVAKNLFDANLQIMVTCEGDDEPVGVIDWHTSRSKVFMDDSMCADMITWNVHKLSGERVGAILLVHGNDGYDVIADHTTNLSEYMPESDVMDKIEASCY